MLEKKYMLVMNVLEDASDDELMAIYQEINSWNGDFEECAFYDYECLKDMYAFGADGLEAFVEILEDSGVDLADRANVLFYADAYGWHYTDEPRSNMDFWIDDLAQYLVEEAGYSGFPSWSVDQVDGLREVIARAAECEPEDC